MKSIDVQIDGMHCDGCVSQVAQALKTVPGVAVESVIVGSAKVALDEAVAKPETLVKALEKMGYDARVTTATDPNN